MRLRRYNARSHVRGGRFSRRQLLPFGSVAGDRRRDGGRGRAPRPGRRRGLARPRRRGRAGAPPPGRHRPVAGRPPADAVRVGALRHRLQRRDLQPRGPQAPARSAVSERRGVAGAFRHGNPAGRRRMLGAGRSAAVGRRHVRVRALGPQGPDALAGPRPDGRKAPLLRLAERRVPVRVRAEGARRASRVRGRRRPGRAGPVAPGPLRSVALVDLRGDTKTARGHVRPGRRRPGAEARRRTAGTATVLVVAERRRGGPRATVRRHARRGGGRPARSAARRGPPADGRGRPARRLPVRRDRLVDGRRVDAGAIEPPGANLHDRVRGARLRRGAARPGGGRPSGNRAYRAVRVGAGRAGRHPAPARPCSTSPSPIPRRFRPSWCRRWRAGT